MVAQNRFNKEDHDRSMTNMFNNFSFKKKNEKIDWRKIASLDIDRVSRELDFYALQDNIEHLTYCNIENEIDTRLIDPNFIKLFRLSQLIVEYLLHSQSYLTDVIGNLESQLSRSILEMDELTKKNEKLEKDYHEIKKEIKKNKKIIEKQQILMNPTSTNYHPCSYCSKVFLNLTYLQSHIARRHSQMPFTVGLPQSNQLNEEMEKLREKLKQTEADLAQERQLRSSNSKEDLLIKKMEEWKNEQSRKQMNEIAELKDNFLRELASKSAAYEKTLEELNKRQSNVGDFIRDDVEWDKENKNKQQKQIEELKAEIKSNNQQFLTQINELNQKWNLKYKKLQEKSKRERDEFKLNTKENNSPIPQPPPPPPVIPRGGRSPSPVKIPETSIQKQQPQQVDLYLSDYCLLTREAIRNDTSLLKTAKEAVKKFLVSQLDELGINEKEKGLADGDFKLKMNELKSYRDQTSADLPHFTQMRKEFSDLCNEYCKQRLGASIKSTASRVKFEKNLISTGKRPNNKAAIADSIIKSALPHYESEEEEEEEEGEELSGEVSISNANESNDDDTEPTRPSIFGNAIVSSASKQQQQQTHKNNYTNLKLPPQTQHQQNDIEEISDLESVPGDQLQPNGKKSGFVAQKAKQLDKKLQDIQKHGPKQSKSMVPIGFTPSKKQDDEESVSISSLELDDKPKPKSKLINQQSLDTSTNTSIWASVTHTNHQNGNNGDRPPTANSALTFNLDSDEFDMN